MQTSWGNPHFKVGKKVFAGCDEKDGRLSIQFGLEPGPHVPMKPIAPLMRTLRTKRWS